MFFINFLFKFIYNIEDVCELFSYDADTCINIFGCGFCLDNFKCISYNPINKTNLNNCINNGQFIKPSNGNLGKCFYLFSDDGCAKCVSTEINFSCGWCQSLGACLEGDELGPFKKNSCPLIDWLYEKKKCDKSICASAKNIDQCLLPCKWSLTRKTCYLPRNLTEDSIEELNQKKEFENTKRIFLISGLLLFLSILFSLILYIFNPFNFKFDKLNELENVNLDDFPKFQK